MDVGVETSQATDDKTPQKKTETLLKIVQVGSCTLKTVENSTTHDLGSPFVVKNIFFDFVYLKALALIFVDSKLLHPRNQK